MSGNITESKTRKINAARIGAHNVVTLRESMTWENSESLDLVLNELLEQNNTTAVLDCKSVAFMDSNTLELLLRWHDMLKSKGGILKISGPNAVCRDIFLATRLANTLYIYKDLPEALRSDR